MRMRSINQRIYLQILYCLWYCAYFVIVRL